MSQNEYLVLPKALFQGDYLQLSNDAKLLYALLLDRYVDGEAIVFPRDEMCALLKRSRPVVSNLMKELIDMDLVFEKREGVGQPKKIYIAKI